MSFSISKWLVRFPRMTQRRSASRSTQGGQTIFQIIEDDGLEEDGAKDLQTLKGDEDACGASAKDLTSAVGV